MLQKHRVQEQRLMQSTLENCKSYNARSFRYRGKRYAGNESMSMGLQMNASPEHWAELFFEGPRYGHLTSNISESLNSWLLPARELPVLPILELIR